MTTCHISLSPPWNPPCPRPNRHRSAWRLRLECPCLHELEGLVLDLISAEACPKRQLCSSRSPRVGLDPICHLFSPDCIGAHLKWEEMLPSSTCWSSTAASLCASWSAHLKRVELLLSLELRQRLGDMSVRAWGRGGAGGRETVSDMQPYATLQWWCGQNHVT